MPFNIDASKKKGVSGPHGEVLVAIMNNLRDFAPHAPSSR